MVANSRKKVKNPAKVMCPNAGFSNRDVFIVIPAYNEAGRLVAVVDSLRCRYPNVVVVDDGSTDDTARVASQHGCRVLRHAINRGQGAALQTGITYSVLEGARWIVTFDADGQHQTSDLPALLAPVVTGKVDVAMGSRFLERTSNVPRSRQGLLWAARLFTRMVSGVRLTDCHNGLRALSRRAAEQIHLRQDRMAHASEFYDQMKAAGLSYQEVPVSVLYTAETLNKGQSVFNSISILFQYFFRRVS
jgi:polyprenyl-phospho-N-acetylgalactosaminyl synthase